MIENLGVTEDLYESIDFCDNQILKLENFPILKRLTAILISGNKIIKVAPGLGKSLPNLRVLLLENNQIKTMNDLEALSELGGSLTHLSIANNPIEDEVSNLRPLLFALLPKLSLLDFCKISPADKITGKKLRDRLLAGESLASLVIPKSAVAPVVLKKSSGKVKLTSSQKKSLLVRIDAAKTVEEMEMLEGILLNGVVPAGFEW